MGNENKRRIGLATWYGYRNYGTALQAVALSRAICQMGYQVLVLRHNPVDVERRSGKGLRLAARLAAHLEWRRGYYPILDEGRERLFDNFINSALEFCEVQISSSQERGLRPSHFDAFVCGSDQVWSPRGFDSFYFLDFAKDGIKKVAYAPSFGCDKINDGAIAESMGRLLSSFSSISVREASGAEIVENLIGYRPQVVLDPTLLISRDNLDAFSNEELGRPSSYCLLYFLGHYQQNLAHALAFAKRLGLKAVLVPVFERDKKSQHVQSMTVGPAEFLSLVKHASHVFTDSFHGIALSSQFGVPFTCYERFRPSSSTSQNTRIYNILNILGAGNCLVTRKSLERCGMGMSLPEIDWEGVIERLNKGRVESQAFLRNALARACREE